MGWSTSRPVRAAEIVIGAVVGALGLLPTWRALELGRRVALANKETLVVAGELMTAAAARVRSRTAAGRQRAQRAPPVPAWREARGGQAGHPHRLRRALSQCYP
jgi:hypothetical protein